MANKYEYSNFINGMEFYLDKYIGGKDPLDVDKSTTKIVLTGADKEAIARIRRKQKRDRDNLRYEDMKKHRANLDSDVVEGSAAD